MEIKQRIDLLESLIKNPSKGMLEDIFLFVTRITPIINVDLLIKNKQNQTLLTWRDDGFYPPGWHIPGGIVRYKEKISDRIKAVAVSELGAKIEFIKEPLAINEVIHPLRKNRGHFISLLYRCALVGAPAQSLKQRKGIPRPGEWAWHSACPENIISVHRMYRKFI
ncbi:MAG: NUDIX hydrolase [Candidatus Omnitrophica bacterium]|nr:NUDIX hydrolase [Candidatus Omnitrophota bacterium]